MKSRISKLKSLLKDLSVDGLLLTNHKNCWPDMYYATGVKDVWPAYLWVDESRALLFCHDGSAFRTKEVDMVEIKGKHNILNLIKNEVETQNKKLGLSFEVPARFMKEVKDRLNPKEVVDISPKLKEIRAVKEHDEIKRIRIACSILDEVFEKLTAINFWKNSSRDAAWMIKAWLAEKRADAAFEPIVNFDESSASVHYGKERREMKRLALVDVGVRFKEYCSDATRMFIAKDDALFKACDKLVDVMDSLKKHVKAGMKISEVCKLAEDLITERFERKHCYFNFHSLGHGIGIEVHEHPKLTKDLNAELRKNMIITLEPAIYKKTYGLRIESTFVVGKRKLKELNTTPYIIEV